MGDERKQRLDALFAAARREPPTDTANLEACFETRVMARLAERKPQETPWQLLVWRMVPAFAAIAAIVLVCSIALNPARRSDPFAPITSGHEEQLALADLLGE